MSASAAGRRADRPNRLSNIDGPKPTVTVRLEGPSPSASPVSTGGALGSVSIGPIASPDAVQFAPGLPKTRSGKIMRRILRKIAEGDVSSLGDTSTLADPAVVDDLVKNRVG